MKREIKLTGKQLADVLSISGQAVSQLEKRGRLIRDEVGLYDLKNPENKKYVEGRGIDIKKIVVPSPVPSGRPTIARSQGSIKSAVAGPDKSLSELNREKTIKQIEKLSIENRYRRGELLDAELVHTQVFFFLDSVCNSMQRNASAFLSDVASKILTEGELTSSIRSQWIKVVLEQFDLARKETIKRIEKIQELQK